MCVFNLFVWSSQPLALPFARPPWLRQDDVAFGAPTSLTAPLSLHVSRIHRSPPSQAEGGWVEMLARGSVSSPSGTCHLSPLSHMMDATL